MLTGKIGVSNRTKLPRIVWVEPWGEDYTLLPGEELLILCRDDREQPWFQVDENDDSCQVHIMAAQDFEVRQEDKHLTCGHNRKHAVAARLKL